MSEFELLAALGLVSGAALLTKIKMKRGLPVSDAEIYRYLLGDDVEIGVMYNSPIPGREDDTPSFKLSKFKKDNGETVITWVDFGLGRPQLGSMAQHLLMEMRQCSYQEALRIMRREIKTKNYGEPFVTLTAVNKPKLSPKFEYSDKFEDYELAYYEQFGIGEDQLIHNEIYRLEALDWGNGGRVMRSTKTNPKFLLNCPNGGKKIYAPLTRNKKEKWFTWDIKGGYLYGLEDVPDGQAFALVSSRKDKMVAELCDLYAVNVSNEGNFYGLQQAMPEIQQRGLRPFAMLDGDDPGWKATLGLYVKAGLISGIDCRGKLGTYRNKPVKDISDHAKFFGLESLQSIMPRLIASMQYLPDLVIIHKDGTFTIKE